MPVFNIQRASMLAALIGSLTVSAAIAAENLCETDKRVVASCFDVHGRLRINANLRLYLWPVGTQRMLTVHYANNRPEADPPLPANLADIMKTGADVFADYRVCPFTKSEPGKRQSVCVASASRVVIRPNGS